MTRLAKLKNEVEDKFCIIPRIYTSKPRTNGNGYNGLRKAEQEAKEAEQKVAEIAYEKIK